MFSLAGNSMALSTILRLCARLDPQSPVYKKDIQLYLKLPHASKATEHTFVLKLQLVDISLFPFFQVKSKTKNKKCRQCYQ
jgi:hypothetical protein